MCGQGGGLSERVSLAVVGGGPAGLRAAEVAAGAGGKVVLFEGKPSVGRKFLVAGKGGLNLTHGEELERFVTRYQGTEQPPGVWERLIGEFGPQALREWAAGLGVETFQATSGRVYPKAMKAAPLLRRWIERLRGLGVDFRMNRRCVGFQADGGGWRLEFADGEAVRADAVVFALGGGSWIRTGSDGKWQEMFQEKGLEVHALEPANCGWEHDWPEAVRRYEGTPLKNLHVSAGGATVVGELMVTRYGLEGGAIYQLGAVLRAMVEPAVVVDFKPTFTHEALVAKMESVRRNFLQEAGVRWKLPAVVVEMLAAREWEDAIRLAREVKAMKIDLIGPRPLDEAISSAGGICWSEVDDSLMLKKMPGVFVAGEMIDWEAPTGGYLMQGCFASATRAGSGAAEWAMRGF